MDIAISTVRSADEVLRNIEALQGELETSPELASRLASVHAWYIDPRDPGNPLFGFSKFLGYRDLDAGTYLENARELNGRNTEKVLKAYFDPLHEGTPAYGPYRSRLEDWLAGFGKTPRQDARLMILKPEFQEGRQEEEDRGSLEALFCLAKKLPAHQRRELKDRL